MKTSPEGIESRPVRSVVGWHWRRGGLAILEVRGGKIVITTAERARIAEEFRAQQELRKEAYEAAR
jgi:hypothetical protein